MQHSHSRHQKTTSNLLRINLKGKLRFINEWPLEVATMQWMHVHESRAGMPFSDFCRNSDFFRIFRLFFSFFFSCHVLYVSRPCVSIGGFLGSSDWEKALASRFLPQGQDLPPLKTTGRKAPGPRWGLCPQTPDVHNTFLLFWTDPSGPC